MIGGLPRERARVFRPQGVREFSVAILDHFSPLITLWTMLEDPEAVRHDITQTLSHLYMAMIV